MKVRCRGTEVLAVSPLSPAHPITIRSIDGQPAVFIAELDGRELGRMSITVMPLVHDLNIAKGPLQRKVADALFYYASGKVKAAGFNEAVAFVLEGNEAMQRYLGNRAIPEEPSRIYHLAVQ